MKLYIDDMCSFQHIQYEFSEQYPFLKIDFLRPHIGDKNPLCRKQKVQAIITIDGCRTVGQILQDFEDVFGLSMMMLRRSGNVWIETSLTEDWTLEQQNREGEQVSLAN